MEKVSLPVDLVNEVVESIFNLEYDFIIEDMAGFDNFEEWSEFILERTFYGTAMKIAFFNLSDSEMNRDLKEIWDKHN